MKRLTERILIVALCAVIGWFYLWTVRSGGDDWKFGQKQRDYYNLLIDGWRSGQLSLKVDVPEALLKLPDPYDPQARPPGLALHDASLYRGKYYLYFGAAPVVVLMLPFRLVTGLDLPQPAAALAFVYGGFFASTGVWLALRRRYFAGSSLFVALLGVAVLGVAGLGPVLLRRPEMWELPIGAGYCFAMLALGAVWASLHAKRGRAAWFAAAGLALGLAIASRPTYLIASPLLLAPLIAWWRAERRFPWRDAIGALVPLACIGALLAWHNFARFGDPLQFGQKYQLSLDYEAKVQHFSPRYVPFNLWRYFFSPAQWSWYYPFIAPAEVPPKPAGFAGHDDVYGLLRNFPVGWLAFIAPLACWRREGAERLRLAAWLAAAALLFAGLAGTLACFFGSLARYESDFTPALMLLAGAGLLALERWVGLTWPAPVRSVPRFAWTVAAAMSVMFGILFSLQLDGLLKEHNPAKARDVARAWNRVPAALEKILRLPRGAVELNVLLAPRAEGTQTLLTVGDPPHIDVIAVDTVDRERVRLRFGQPDTPAVFSRPLALDFSRPHQVKVLLGSMLPPSTHPFYDGRTAAEISAFTRSVHIELDGETVIDERRRFVLGTGRIRVESAVGFEGQAMGFRRLPLESHPAGEATPAGFTRVRLTFPGRASAPREPLLAFGNSDGAVVLFAHYFDDGGRIAFGTSCRGERSPESEPLVANDAPHEFVARWWKVGDPARRLLEVRVDAVIVFSREVAWTDRDDAVAAGRNLSGEPGCAAAFTGTIHQMQRSADGSDPLLGPGDTLRLRIELPVRAPSANHHRDPLIVTGRNGGGDLFVVEYLGDQRVRFALDHWGSGMIASPPVLLGGAKPHDVEVTLESLNAPADAALERHVKRGPVRVVLDGADVWTTVSEFFTADADEVAVGRNPIGGTSAGAVFEGRILSAERVKRD